MIKKVIKYVDHNGQTKTKAFYFNMNRVESAELETSKTGGIKEYVKRIVEAENQAALIAILKEVILLSYGEKSADGEQFVKTKELRDKFEQSEAFVELFMELANSDVATAEFFNGITPQQPVQQFPNN